MIERRKFLQICLAGTGACAPATSWPAAEKLTEQRYARVKLVDADGKAVRSRSLKARHNYIFHYPYVSTPCFLLNLGRTVTGQQSLLTEKGDAYEWQGGVGIDNAIVAYSAICAHKLAYPTRQVSFIGFRATPSPVSSSGNVISCCADKSVYDPARGAKVLSGPAQQPLAGIRLHHDAVTDELFAVGTFGGEKFAEFFQKYDFKLSMELGGKARDLVQGTTRVLDMASYSQQTAQC